MSTKDSNLQNQSTPPMKFPNPHFKLQSSQSMMPKKKTTKMTFWILVTSWATYIRTMRTSRTRRTWRSRWYMRRRRRWKGKTWSRTPTNVWKTFNNGSKSASRRSWKGKRRQRTLQRTKNKSRTSSQIASFKMPWNSMKSRWLCTRISKKQTLRINPWRLNRFSKRMRLEIRSIIIWRVEVTNWHSSRPRLKK